MKDKWQRCTICSRKIHAELLWQNDSSMRRTSETKAREHNGKPHLRDLCEACLELGSGLGCWMSEEQRCAHLLRLGYTPEHVKLMLQRLNRATGR
jgi:hypothetical protein